MCMYVFMYVCTMEEEMGGVDVVLQVLRPSPSIIAVLWGWEEGQGFSKAMTAYLNVPLA